MKSLRIAVLLAIAVSVAASAYAHHSAAGIDQTKTVQLPVHERIRRRLFGLPG